MTFNPIGSYFGGRKNTQSRDYQHHSMLCRGSSSSNSFPEQLPGSWKAGQTPTRSSPHAPPAFPGPWSRELTAQRMRWQSVVPARGRATQLCYLSFWGSGIQPRLAGASASRSREAVPGCRPGLWPMHRSTWRVQDHSRWRDSALHELLGERHPFLHFAGGLTPLATWASSERTSLGGQAPVTPICNGSLSFCAVRFRSPWGASQGARPVWGPHPRPTLYWDSCSGYYCFISCLGF